VLRDGEAVPVGEWRSKKARDLLRLLVTRRGSSTPRDFIMETLWPNGDPLLTSNRLSVALNVVRRVLDPEHRFEPGRFVASTSDGIRLEHVHVDVEHFLEKAGRALRLSETEEPARAVTLLEEATAAYGGDFLEEDRYEDWAAPLREEERSAYLDVLHALISTSEAVGRSPVRYHLRILALDPFDEETHLGLVSTLSAAGRHGEAKRAYRRYVDRMDEISVEPAPRPER
jgi:DNA-binding SARP family transcriptional activator